VTRLRAAFIGTGRIAEYHAPALRMAGFALTAACAREGSTNVSDFARRQEIPKVYEAVDALLDARTEWDCIIIMVPPEATIPILSKAISLRAPILVEKPVALSSAVLEPYLHPQKYNVMVGYNRRWYQTAAFARSFVHNGGPVISSLFIPEASSDNLRKGERKGLRRFFVRGVHALDLARFVFGDLELKHVTRLKSEEGRLMGIAAVLASTRGDILQLSIPFDTPANYAFTFGRKGERFEMRPLEYGTLYKKLETVPSSPERPIRTYRPIPQEHIEWEATSSGLKPGFLGQARAFAALVRGQSPRNMATLEDAYHALRLAERLVSDQ